VDACIEGIGAALHQVQMVGEREPEGLICFISRQLKDSEKNYGASQLECLCLVWALEKLYYYLDGCLFEVITECIALKLLLNMKTLSRHMMRWQIAIQEWRGSMTIVHRVGFVHQNADGLSRWALPNDANNPAADLSDTIHKVPVVGILVSSLLLEFWEGVGKSYSTDSNATCLVSILKSKELSRPDLVEALAEPWKLSFLAGHFVLLDGLLYRCSGNECAVVLVLRADILSVLSECHDVVTSGHLLRDRTMDRVKALAWWPTYSRTQKFFALAVRDVRKLKELLVNVLVYSSKSRNRRTDGK
jgi:hypothetical protein